MSILKLPILDVETKRIVKKELKTGKVPNESTTYWYIYTGYNVAEPTQEKKLVKYTIEFPELEADRGVKEIQKKNKDDEDAEEKEKNRPKKKAYGLSFALNSSDATHNLIIKKLGE